MLDQGDCHMSILFKQSEIEIEKKLILSIDTQIELILRYAITESRVFVNHFSDLVTYTKWKTNDSKGSPFLKSGPCISALPVWRETLRHKLCSRICHGVDQK